MNQREQGRPRSIEPELQYLLEANFEARSFVAAVNSYTEVSPFASFVICRLFFAE